ncbi:Choline kinase beta, partial [Trichostrongylus colubriformis]
LRSAILQTYFKSHDELDLRSKILSLCSDVLGGKWVDLHPDNISISHVRGGLTNLMYLVSRPKFSSSDEQSATVLLRIQSQTDHEKLLNELVVFTSLAESGLGPKLLGIFPGGRFEEYIPSRPVDHHEVTDLKICTLLARLLPRFHSTAVPISKRPSLVNMMREWLALFEEQGNSHVQMRTTSFQLHPNTFPPVVSTSDLARELDTVEEFLSTSSSPVVFCHNDLTESLSLNLVDFEFSAYNYRGFDLANYFCAAAIEHNLREYPRYRIDLNKLHNRTMKLEFCKEYVREAKKLNIHIKSEFSLLREINQFAPVVHLFWAIFNLYCEKQEMRLLTALWFLPQCFSLNILLFLLGTNQYERSTFEFLAQQLALRHHQVTTVKPILIPEEPRLVKPKLHLVKEKTLKNLLP